LEPVGYTYIEDGNIIKIVNKESLNEEPITTEVFLINYARAADILPTITTLVDPARGKIVVDARSNSLVITERPTRMGRIRPIIEQLDRATDQVMIETKFVEVTDTDVKNIGVNWASLANYKLGAGPFNGTFDRQRGQIASDDLKANNDNTRTATNGATGTTNTTVTNSQNSGATNNGLVSSNNGVVSNTSSTGSTGALTNSTTSDTASGTNNLLTDTITNALTGLNSLTNTGDTSRALTAVFSADQFQLVLSALQSQNETKIVSNPTVVTLNNTEAVINVGQERPIPRYQFNQQTGNLEVNGFDFKPIGVILKVTPQVNSRGFIKLTVAPEVSQSLNSVNFNGNAIPIIDTRKASTQVSLKDGFTMGIGGLITTSLGVGVTKIPVLGSIPLFGRLFRSDSKTRESTNLIIFITAKTISAEGGAVEQVFNSERVRQLKMKREDLPGFRDGSSPYPDEAAASPAPSRSTSPGARQ
jgi:type IV pilus assembly protein PilQ